MVLFSLFYHLAKQQESKTNKNREMSSKKDSWIFFVEDINGDTYGLHKLGGDFVPCKKAQCGECTSEFCKDFLMYVTSNESLQKFATKNPKLELSCAKCKKSFI